MILQIENLGAIDRLTARFRMLVNPDATPLMVTWMRLIEADSRRGILAGQDKDGMPLAAVTYRPIGPAQKTTRAQRLGLKASQRGRFGGHGPLASGLHNNLTSAEYRQLGGPPLAPRGAFSRTVTNLQTEFDPSARSAGRWEAYGWWDQVVSTKGEKFLHYHFYGIGQKRRDLTGVRPDGVQKARRAAVNWMRDLVRSGGV